MPDVSKLGGGWGVGANITDATFYLAVIEEYGNGAVSHFAFLWPASSNS
jgi:hypothetical protein